MAKKKEPEENPLDDLDMDDILVDGKFYQGNENILRKDATFKWTDEMVAENNLCMKNILRFAEQHFYIVTEEGKKKIELYKFQKRLLKAFKNNRFNVVLSSRQSCKCFKINTLCKIRNKITCLIEEISVGEFYNRFNKKID